MNTQHRARIGVSIALGLATCATVVLALSVVYGLALEYGGGSFVSVGFLVVPPPVLLAALAVVVWPWASARARVSVVLGTVVLVIVGGVGADALGSDAHRERLAQESRDFTCNGPNVEVRVAAQVDRTWRELPRRAPIYGPIEGSPTHCVAGVAGDGDRTFTDYTEAFRDLDGWRVEEDQPQLFVMAREGVRVTVLSGGAPDRLTTLEVAVAGSKETDGPHF